MKEITFPKTEGQTWSELYNFSILVAISIIIFSCDEENAKPAPIKTISYHADGRNVKYGDPFPIALDIGNDGTVDFTVFVELTANGAGDHLYAGVNPIGYNLIKSGPADEQRFLSMGLLVAEEPDAQINGDVGINERWSSDHNALVIRHTTGNDPLWYEGDWDTNTAEIVGIQWVVDDNLSHFGWLRLMFDKTTEVVTLVDYAYETTAGRAITAGDH